MGESNSQGTIEYIGQKHLGLRVYEFMKCKDCGTEYPVDKNKNTWWNGQIITICPYCEVKNGKADLG